jgi:hypothetical protein
VRHLALLLLSAGLVTLPADARAQEERVRLVGLTFDHWRGATGPALLRPTLRLTTYTGRGPGLDFALVIFPDGISIHPPAVVLGLQAGVAQPVPAGPATLLLKAGAAGIAAAGLLGDSRLFHLVPGVHAGLGLLVPVDSKSSLRFDVTRHLYDIPGHGRSFWSFGVGFAAGLRRGR